MTGRETRAAALTVSAAIMAGFGLFTVAFGATFDSLEAVGIGAATVGTSIATVRKSTTARAYPAGGAA